MAPHPIRPAIYFYDRGGHLIDPESVVEVTVDLEVTEGGSLTVQTEMDPLAVLTISTHGQGELVSGSVKVLSDGPIGGGGRYGVPEIGVAGVGANPPVRDVLFPARRQEGGINTGVALHNLKSSPGLVRCDLMREGVLRDSVSILWRPTGRRPGSSTRLSPPPIRPTSRGRCAAMRWGRGCSAPWPWKWTRATASSSRFRWCRSRAVEASREIRDNMTEDERQYLVGAVSEARVSLSEVAFKLRREVTPKVPALKAAIKAERETFRLRRELQQLDIKNLEQAEERESLPEVHWGGREP